MAGPAKKPAGLKVVAGTERKDRQSEGGVELPVLSSIPKAPDWLPNSHAVKEWDRNADGTGPAPVNHLYYSDIFQMRKILDRTRICLTLSQWHPNERIKDVPHANHEQAAPMARAISIDG